MLNGYRLTGNVSYLNGAKSTTDYLVSKQVLNGTWKGAWTMVEGWEDTYSTHGFGGTSISLFLLDMFEETGNQSYKNSSEWGIKSVVDNQYLGNNYAYGAFPDKYGNVSVVRPSDCLDYQFGHYFGASLPSEIMSDAYNYFGNISFLTSGKRGFNYITANQNATTKGWHVGYDFNETTLEPFNNTFQCGGKTQNAGGMEIYAPGIMHALRTAYLETGNISYLNSVNDAWSFLNSRQNADGSWDGGISMRSGQIGTLIGVTSNGKGEGIRVKFSASNSASFKIALSIDNIVPSDNVY